MTYQQKLMDYVFQIDILLDFIPQCKSEKQQNTILYEVGSIRRRVTEIEEMTRTEKQRKCKVKIMTIESEMNNFK